MKIVKKIIWVCSLMIVFLLRVNNSAALEIKNCAIVTNTILNNKQTTSVSLITNSSNESFLIANIIILLLIILLFFIFGRDKPLVKPVAFKPPQHLSSAQVGYLAKRKISSEELNSLIVYWAAKGYLEIIENDSERIYFRKIKAIDGKEMIFEQKLFNALFSEANLVSKNNIPVAFYHGAEVAGLEYRKYYDEQTLHSPLSLLLQVITFLMASLIPFLYMLHIVFDYNSNSMTNNNQGLDGIAWITLAGLIAGGYFLCGALNHRQVQTKITNNLRTLSSILILLATLIVSLVFATMVDADLSYMIPIFITSYVAFIFVGFMPKVDKKNEEMIGEFVGLKTSLEYAEKRELEANIYRNPKKYYDIIPYAYVLGVTHMWINKFEVIDLFSYQVFAGGKDAESITLAYKVLNSVPENIRLDEQELLDEKNKKAKDDH
ncbi:DUF2207 domain-containing protein [Erysipelotrichaceae bacterium OttesenSCG-928-M19]|nr:DUF2207 domain-containing protein [Erysipelotrichaceae bacterium OttesenSCG-928-M19]